MDADGVEYGTNVPGARLNLAMRRAERPYAVAASFCPSANITASNISVVSRPVFVL